MSHLQIIQAVRRFFKEEAGQTLVEYAILMSLVAFGAIAVLTAVGKKASHTFHTAGRSLSNHVAAGDEKPVGNQMNVVKTPSLNLSIVKKFLPNTWTSSTPIPGTSDAADQSTSPVETR